jgi:thiol-disulfide isomerase/thioredoxin
MIRVFRNLSFVLLLAVFVGGISSCSSTVTSEKGPDGTPAANGTKGASGADAEQAKKNNPNYRPIEKAVDEGELKLIDGSTTRVLDKRGKVVLLNMWATWCGPCRAEMPTLVKMQETHRDHGFEVIGLNTDDETVEQINDFAGKMKLNYTLAWVDTAYQTELVKISKFGGIPQSFIIDRDGNLRGVFRGAAPGDVKKMEELIDLIVNE